MHHGEIFLRHLTCKRSASALAAAFGPGNTARVATFVSLIVVGVIGVITAAVLLKRAAGIAKGSGAPNKDKVGKVTLKQVEDIARQKMPDLNAASVESAIKSVRGTARSMGIEVVG